MLAQWTTHIAEEWLTPVLAEALITHRIGSPEHWASLITPTEFQQLKDRVDIEFPATNAPQFTPGDDIQFDVTVKNTPKLIVKIFELNTLNFFQTQQRQLNTDLNLDGLVANSEQTHTFEGGPFARTRQTFKFPELKGKRGAWIIEFIGGGRSSRALIRTGQLHVLQQTGPSGDLILVLDEKHQPVNDAVAWFEGRKLVSNDKFGRIVIPFTNQPGTKNLIIGDAAGTFATLASFTHHAEDYRLDAQFHIEREQLLARREATLAVRTALMVGEAHLAPELLTEPKLTITSTTLDGISTTREVKDLKLSAGSDLTHTLTVPERLASLTVDFSAKVDVVSAGGTKKDLTASHTWTLNGIDKTEARRQAADALARVGLSGAAAAKPAQLSGGMAMRVSLARALVMEPKLLLLDEPLSNLDAKLRELMRFELKRLQRELKITTVYVTHDQSEALALSHQVAVMNLGRIQQIGSPRDIYERPQNQFVGDFVGITNFVDGRVLAVEAEQGFYRIDTEIGALRAYSVEPVRAGDKVVLSIRPEDVDLSDAQPADTRVNAWHAMVDQKVFLGEAMDFQIKVGERTLLSRTHPSVRTPIGQRVWARIEPAKVVAMPASAELQKSP